MKKNKSDKTFTKESISKVYFTQEADVSSKLIFGNHTLCAQFLRDYADLPMLKNVQPEDIEDVSERYHLFKEVEHNSDTVKKIRLKNIQMNKITGKKGVAGNEELPVYLISLIEHKGRIDYNVNMQILKYMVCIWENWEKESGITNPGKDFRYPPIFPIVYYEGTGQWTAAKHLSERILMGELFQKYIPDFEYKLVKIHDYTNRELLDYEDAISVLMLINKIQRAEDFEGFEDISAEEINRIYKKSPKDVEEILVEMVYALCRKINLSDRETKKYIKEARGGNMGYLWENMEKMDIQQERRNTANALKRADEVMKQRNEAEKQRDDTFRILVQVYQKQGKTKEETVDLINQESQLEKSVITEAVNRYWKKR